jgi:xylan 1,4-beta-xylosidase
MNSGQPEFRCCLALLLIVVAVHTGSSQQPTYCNPLNIDYAYVVFRQPDHPPNHRSTADPVIVVFKGKYYLFCTNQYGYWSSDDMLRWKFIPRNFLKPYHNVNDNLCAPAAAVVGDSMLLIGSTYTNDFPLWMSTDPTGDHWVEAVDSFQVGAWDPDLFLDDDGRLYIYFGSSNLYPIYGQEIDRRTLQPLGQRQELLRLDDDVHGWERFGEHNDNIFLRPFIEGAWMNKYHGTYYLQYAAPGTEFSGYADGVYVGDHPLGPFRYQAHNPFSYKPGGFVRGAGHGATFQDVHGNWWHVATIRVSVKNNFERRIGLWPAGFDSDDVLYCNTAYGDYPHTLPDGKRTGDGFAGWMLLNANTAVVVSSTLGGFAPNFAVDEDIRTYWSAATGNKGEWLQSDLGAVCTVHAVQINYADQGAMLTGKQSGIVHQYIIRSSLDGKRWSTMVDKADNNTDVPHDYVQLKNPIEARYLRVENIHVPTGAFALSGFRVFGKGHGDPPDRVKQFVVLRGESERRNAWLKWQQSGDADGYTVYVGIAPDKLYTSIMVYGTNEYFFNGMDRNRSYFFQIEAFNKNGIGERGNVVEAR